MTWYSMVVQILIQYWLQLIWIELSWIELNILYGIVLLDSTNLFSVYWKDAKYRIKYKGKLSFTQRYNKQVVIVQRLLHPKHMGVAMRKRRCNNFHTYRVRAVMGCLCLLTNQHSTHSYCYFADVTLAPPSYNRKSNVLLWKVGIDWRLVQGVPRISPNLCWRWASAPPHACNPSRISGIESGWTDGCLFIMFVL